MNQKLSTRSMAQISLATALIIVVSQLSIPMPYGVPITGQTLIIPLVAIVFGEKKGVIASLLYLVIGSVGLPVFAGFTSGTSIVFGPTGGFLLSFPLMAFAAGYGEKKNHLYFGLVCGIIINFVFGMVMYSSVTNSSIAVAFTACVLPFIPTSIVKIIFVGIVSKKIKLSLSRRGVLS